MQPGDRQQMRQAGLAECLLDLLGHRAALAGDHRGGDAAGRAGQRRVDPRRHLGAQPQQPFAPAATSGLLGGGDAARRAKAVADPADAGEIEFALHVAPARQQLRRHRVDKSLEADPVARLQRIAGRRDMETQAVRLGVGRQPEQRIGHDDNPPAAIERIDVDDPAGNCGRAEPALQHRGAALEAGLLRHREPGRDKGEGDPGIAQCRPAAQRHGDRGGGDGRRAADPGRRFARQGKIERDAGAEKHRQPQNPAVAFGRERLGKTSQWPEEAARRRAKTLARRRQIRHRRPSRVSRE